MRRVAPSRPAGPYLIGSTSPWWRLGAGAWQEPAFNGAWVSPLPALPAAGGEAPARLEMRVQAAGGARYTMSAAEGEQLATMGWVSQWGDVTRAVPLSRTEGTVGMTGEDAGGSFGPGVVCEAGDSGLQILIGPLKGRAGVAQKYTHVWSWYCMP